MAQKLIQTQAQKLQQLQKLTAQQILQVKLLEMPLHRTGGKRKCPTGR